VLDDQEDDWRRVFLRQNRLIKAYLEIDDDVSMKKYQWSKKICIHMVMLLFNV
jgi:hypothetical protein